MLCLATITSFIKDLRIQWLDHTLREGIDLVRIVFKWKPQGKRPKKRWIDEVTEDLNTMGIENWQEIIHDRKVARYIVIYSKTC